MSRVEALQAVVRSLQSELDALRAFDIEALALATSAKQEHLGALDGVVRDEVTPEVRALAEEAARLNETARAYVNLMAANVRRQLELVTGGGAPAYARMGMPLRVA